MRLLLNVLASTCDDSTERHGRVVNAPASYSGGPGLKSRPEDRLSCLKIFRGFCQSLQINVGIVF
jgi:hypothetical protein